MAVKDRAWFTVETSELAMWLRNEGRKSWWTVDGDPYLMERISFPCQGEDLAELLDKTTKSAILLDKDETSGAAGERLTAGRIDSRIAIDDEGNRVAELAWNESPDRPWLLIEDKEMEEIVRTLQAGDEE